MSLAIVGLMVLALASPLPGGAAESPWSVVFEEAKEASGIVHQNGGYVQDPAGTNLAWPAFPEIIGPGSCWADLDGDGYDDLFIANQRYNDKNPFSQGYNELFDPVNSLYMNNGDGTFTERAAQAGVESRTFDHGCSAVDYDADGHVDLLVYGFGVLKLYRNNGDGTFTHVTMEAGLDVSTLCLPYDCWNTCSAWMDYNGNDWLDLFVCTYVESDMEDDLRSPQSHIAQYNLLFRNNGDGTFTELAEAAGVQGIASDASGSKSLGAIWFDADRNGRPDLYVANDMTPNEMYWNNGDGTFTRDDDAGLYDDRAGMGVASGDTTRDGYPDVYITHYSGEHNGFYENRGDRTFLDRSGEDGLAGDFMYVGWGTHLVDLDRDGYLDIVAINGHTMIHSPGDQDTLVFRQEPQGDGSTKWVDKSGASGQGILDARISRGASFADATLDGNMDIVIGNTANQSVQYLRGSGNTNSWLYVQPVQEGPNHQAVGGIVEVEAGGVVQTREIQAGSSYMSQNSLLADFGLGDAGTVDRVTVHWPNGGTTTVADLPVDHVVRIDRTTGGWVTDTLSPVTTASIVGDDGSTGHWFQSGIEVHLDVVDRAVGVPSGVAWTQYRFVKEGAVGDWEEYDGEVFSFPAVEGEHVLQFRSMDEADNLEPLRRERFGVDFTAPTVDHEIVGTLGSNGWWLNASLNLSAEDPLSGVEQIRYRIDDSPWQVYGGSVPFSEGEYRVEYTATDRVGNEAPVAEVEIRVDPTPPELKILEPEAGSVGLGGGSAGSLGDGPAVIVTTPDPLGGSEVRMEVEAFDETSGIARLDWLINEEPQGTFLGGGPEYAWVWNTSHEPAGTYLLQVVAQDVAGNIQSESRLLVLIPATEQGAIATLTGGPSLYPLWTQWPV